MGFNTSRGSSTSPSTPTIAMGSNSNPDLGAARPVSPNGTINEERLKYSGLPARNCSCQRNSIVCHHRSAIYTTATIRELNGVEQTDAKYVPHSIVLKIPPPQPESYTTHLAILRNPKHQEWKSRPHKYLSPALSNISPHYVKRFVEPAAREDLIQGIWPGRPEFTLSKVQACELDREWEQRLAYKFRKKDQVYRLEEELRRLEEEFWKQEEDKREEEMRRQRKR
ncbi:hypothetical protein OCU04_009470 [Sclerotinia nivalis]|uniref:Uncharacterized protein n=1 Tax=Sclerotinia nivalis TaxID=352851 RepID=A0A9X0DG55_9HELO|nr:hypothetical protein OCU04_009470 [Sclerotinia nivalis]